MSGDRANHGDHPGAHRNGISGIRADRVYGASVGAINGASYAANPTSDARGIAQRIEGWGPGYEPGNAGQQIAWMINYIKGRPRAPKGAAFEVAAMNWKRLQSDPDAKFDVEVTLDARDIVPMVTWGTSPEQALPITASVPDPAKIAETHKREAAQRALDYMGLQANMKLTDIKVDHVFIGSCTNGRIEDLRAAAEVARGRHVARGVNAIVVPGSGLVKEQAEQEGLDQVFLDAGFEWREPGCSMCLAMNADKLQPGERCASTTNRNFKGRQGPGARTHLMSPAMAAAAAVTGHLTDARELLAGRA